MSARAERGARGRGQVGAVRLGLELGLAAALVAALGIFHVWSRTRVVAAGYALYELQSEHARLVAAQDQLRIELGMLTAPAELERAARTKLSRLGMAPPDRGAVWAAGPGRPVDGAGRAGVDGVGHPPRPAEPAHYTGGVMKPPPPGPPLATRRPVPAGPPRASLPPGTAKRVPAAARAGPVVGSAVASVPRAGRDASRD